VAEYLAVVACGSPLAARVHDVAAAGVETGWLVRVVATASAMNWVDAPAVERVTGHPPLVEQRRPDEPKRFPTPTRVVVCHATLNSISKLATGIMDNYAAGLLCEALATGIPITIVPMISDRLWGHPAVANHLATLARAGVTFVDPCSGERGRPWPVAQGTDAASGFDPKWVLG
jgi:phosphopantothenoylcysteine synthetase/decarboxylase